MHLGADTDFFLFLLVLSRECGNGLRDYLKGNHQLDVLFRGRSGSLIPCLSHQEDFPRYIAEKSQDAIPPQILSSRMGVAQINQEGLRRCWSMFPLARVPFWYRFFEPQPNKFAPTDRTDPQFEARGQGPPAAHQAECLRPRRSWLSHPKGLSCRKPEFGTFSPTPNGTPPQKKERVFCPFQIVRVCVQK